jgi:hypothetical protein
MRYEPCAALTLALQWRRGGEGGAGPMYGGEGNT